MLIFALALALRLAAVFWLRSYETVVGSEHEVIAQSLLSGLGFGQTSYFGAGYFQPTSWTAPVYPVLLAFVFYFGGPQTPLSFLMVELVQVLLASATCIVLFRIGERISGWSVGILAAALLAVYPDFVYMPTQHRPVTLIILLLGGLVLYVLKLRAKPARRDAITAGTLAGLLVLTEPVALGFVVLAFGWVFVLANTSIKGKTRVVSSALIVFLVILAPWMVRNYVVQGKFVIKSSFGYQLWSGNNPSATGTLRLRQPSENLGRDERSADELRVAKRMIVSVASTMPEELKLALRSEPEVVVDEKLTGAAIEFIIEHPRRFLELLAIKAYYFWWFDPTDPMASPLIYRMPWAVLLPLAMAGVYLSRRQWKELSLLYLLAVAFSLPSVVTVVEARYRMPIEPFAVLFAAYTGASLFRYLTRTQPHSYFKGAWMLPMMLSPRPSRILVVHCSLSPWGASRLAVNDAASLVDQGFAVGFASEGGALEMELVAAGVRTHRLRFVDPERYPRWVRYLIGLPLSTAQLLLLVATHKYDCLFVQHRQSGLPSTLVSWLTGAQYVFASNTELGSLNRLPAATPLGRNVIAVSEQVKRNIVAHFRVPAELVAVIPNATRIDVVRADEGTLHAFDVQWGIAPGSPVVACVAALVEIKAHDTLLSAWAQVVKRCPRATLVLTGDGPMRQRLDSLCRELGISRTVRFVGYVEDISVVYSRACIAVLASRSEGLPTSVLEAFSHSLPVVATAVGGTPEVVLAEETGLLVAPDEREQLAAAITRLLSDGQLRQRLGAAGRRLIVEKYSATARKLALSDYLTNVLEGRGKQLLEV